MLFNSYIFLFGFLPVTLIGYQLAARWHRRAVVAWLALASLAFYAYWRPAYLLLLCASILFNYTCGALISRRIPSRLPTQVILIFAVVVNVALLCYYKYLIPLMNFAAGTAHIARRWDNLVLPLGISFFTLTQIAYLVDLQQDEAVQQDLASYTLFATFFPHLIAGPILHHSEIMPQFQQDRDYSLRGTDLILGFSWFVMGLAKKVLLADRFALLADPAFDNARHIGTYGGWVGVLSYALQLYFDFSGYSDMAIGLARMFSVDFPLNFESPYKAPSIIEFWQRWHITLTRYINMYIYNPLALRVSRARAARGQKISRAAMRTPAGFLHMVGWPTLVSLLLAGIWHGAGFQFVIFGLLHALYLKVNHAWRTFASEHAARYVRNAVIGNLTLVSRVLLTFLCVLIAQVFFRASGTRVAIEMLRSLVGLHGPASPGSYQPSPSAMILIVLGLSIVWFLPNTQQILLAYTSTGYMASPLPTGKPRWHWHPTMGWALSVGAVLFAVLVKMENPTSFLYFQF